MPEKHSNTGKMGKQGFSLVETLIVIAVFSIGILAVAAMQTTSVKGNTSARRITEATALAESQIERLLGLPYDHNDLNPDLPHQLSQSPYTINWGVAETDLDEDGTHDSKTVSVTVSWNYRGNRHVTMQHIIPQ